MQLAAYKANAWQEMCSLVKVSQCVTQQRASKGRMPMWKCTVWSKWKSASVEYCVQDQCQCCEQQQATKLSKLQIEL